MSTINYALNRTHVQGSRRAVPFDLRECVHFFNLLLKRMHSTPAASDKVYQLLAHGR